MEPNHSSSSSFLLLLIFFTLQLSSTARYTITPSQPLAGNDTLVSSNGAFALGFFLPPNSDNQYIGLWYNQISDHSILWVANRQNPVTNSSGGAVLSLTPDGILTITAQNSTVIVWSNTNISTTLRSPVAELLDNGNLVVKQDGDNSSSNYAWQGFDHLTDTLIPGMKLDVDLTTGLNRTLVAWTSPSDPSPGPCHAYMETSGDPELYFMQGSTLLWHSGAWDGTHFSGMPDMGTHTDLSFSFVNNASEVTYSYHVHVQSKVSRLVVNSTGFLQLSLWDSNAWNLFWYMPGNQCNMVGVCGSYGLCDVNNSTMCSCLPGFSPKNVTNWNLRDTSDGCVRNTALDCRNGNDDGFVKLSNMKLPQSANARVYMSLSNNECHAVCLMNCSCMAYAAEDVSDGSGCVMWIGQLFDTWNYAGTGQDLYLRLAAADLVSIPGEIPHKSRSALVTIIVSLLVGVLLLACAGCFLWKRRKRRSHKVTGASNHAKDRPTEEAEGNDLELPLFDFAIIEVATDYFSDGGKLGEGGFGPVYKGKLGDDQEIAVKRLSKNSQQGVDEFKNEVVLIAKLQHRNLVRLLGCCIQQEERMLIYEYLPNKSLDSFLFGTAICFSYIFFVVFIFYGM